MDFLTSLTKSLGIDPNNDLVNKARSFGQSLVPPEQNMSKVPTPSPYVPEQNMSMPHSTAGTDFISTITRALPRSLAGSANSITQSLTGQPQTPYQPQGPVQKFIFGSDPIKSVPQQFEEANKKYIDDKPGARDIFGRALVFASIAGSASGDALPLFGGAEENAAASLFKNSLKDTIAEGTKITDPGAAYNFFRDAGVSDEIAKTKAPLLAATTDDKATKAIIMDTAAEQAQITQNNAKIRLNELESKANGDPKTGVPAQVLSHADMNELSFLQKNINKPSELMNAYKDPTPFKPNVVPDTALASAGKERSYITSAQASESISKDISNDLSDTYTPKSNKELVDKSVERVQNDFEAAKKFAVENSTDEAVATRVAVDKELSARYVNASTPEEKAALASELKDSIVSHARLATEEGRTVQANALLGKQTPEGMLRSTSRMIDDYNKTSKVKIPQISEKDVQTVLDKGSEIEKMPEGLPKEVAKKELAGKLESLIPSPTWKKVVNVWKAGLLTGIKTSGVNIQSNFWNGIGEKVKDIPATGIDMATSLFTGERTKAFNLRGELQGNIEGIKKGWDYLKTGVEDNGNLGKLEFNKVHYDSKPGKVLGAYAEGVYRVLGAEDMPFYYGAMRRSLGEQALVTIKNEGKVFENSTEKTKWIQNFIDNPSKDAATLADMDAKIATFRNDTALGNAATSVRNASPLMETILPFAKTPSAVATQMFNYTPAGAVFDILKMVKTGNFDQKLFSESLGRSVTGTAALWLGSKLYDAGKISLEYPADQKTRDQWEATGKTANSILINGKWVPLVEFGPQGSVMAIGGYFSKGKQDTGSIAGGAVNGFFGGVKGLTEQTFLTGVKNVMDTINDPSNKGQTFVGGLAASVVPTIVGDFTAAFDQYQRKATGTFTGQLKAKIPGLRETLHPKLDVWGQKLERNRSAIDTAVSPIRLSNQIQGPLNTEVEKLSQEGQDIRPTKIDQQIKSVKLNNDEYYQYQKLYGVLISQTLNSLIQNQDYQKQDSETQAKLFTSAISQSKKAVGEIALPEFIKQRYNLPENIDPKLASDVVNELYKTNKNFSKASIDKQKKVILLILQNK